MKIIGLKDGPYLITGNGSTTITREGATETKSGPIALCRCGHSANKPFCDGAHKANGWKCPMVEIEMSNDIQS